MCIHGIGRSSRSPAVKLFKEHESCGAFDALNCGMVSERSLAVGSMGRGVAPHRGQPPSYPGLGIRIKPANTRTSTYSNPHGVHSADTVHRMYLDFNQYQQKYTGGCIQS
jgi:hypothetical protein